MPNFGIATPLSSTKYLPVETVHKNGALSYTIIN
jgi:hypothetical protein